VKILNVSKTSHAAAYAKIEDKQDQNHIVVKCREHQQDPTRQPEMDGFADHPQGTTNAQKHNAATWTLDVCPELMSRNQRIVQRGWLILIPHEDKVDVISPIYILF
jgi:hypothetical protein